MPIENELSSSQVQIFRQAVLSTVAFLFEDDNLGANFMVEQPIMSIPYTHKVNLVHKNLYIFITDKIIFI